MPLPSSALALTLVLAGSSSSLLPEALWEAWPDVRFFNLHDQNRRTTVGDTGRLATVALLSALFGLVEDGLVGEDPEIYESLERNRDHQWVDVLVSGGEVWQPGAGELQLETVFIDEREP